MIEKNIFLICLVVLTLILSLLCSKYIVSEKEKRKMLKQQKEIWYKELLELLESLQYILSDDIKALETYKMIEEIYFMLYFSYSKVGQKHQRLRLHSYKKKWGQKNIKGSSNAIIFRMKHLTN